MATCTRMLCLPIICSLERRLVGPELPAAQNAFARCLACLCDDRAMVTSRTAAKPGAFAIAKADMIEGMAKGMAVLESFDTQRQRLNATLAAERAGITRA